MKILIIGSGGREHALAWKIKQSPMVTKIYCAPGNAGIASIAELVPIKATDLHALLNFAKEHSIDLTVVGPEQPLTLGIVDLFEQNGLKVFGPSKAAAEIEGSKVFAKEFMKKYNIPTAEFRTFDVSHRYDAERYINEVPVPIVVKADGLAAGKGVTVCETKEQALEAIDRLMGQKSFGEAGLKIVVEEYLVGEEASLFAIADSKEFVTLMPAQDHKRILDNDKGKNTGGMGAYAPAPIITDEVLEKIKKFIIRPTLIGLSKEGMPYRGCLFVGLMITETGPKVIEYNCRFGDPETQVVLPLLDDDVVRLMLEASDGKLSTTKVKMFPKSAVCVIIASGGYPDDYEVGKPIMGLESVSSDRDLVVFHSGTALEKDTYVTSGGRVLGVTGFGEKNNLEGTIDKAYRTVEKITFDGAYYRSDIGKKGIERFKYIQNTELQ